MHSEVCSISHTCLIVSHGLLASYWDAATGSGDTTDVAVPIFYCVRHAVELALKDLLLEYHRNQLGKEEIEQHDEKANTASPLPEDVLKKLSNCHQLREILGAVQQWLPSYVGLNWSTLIDAIDRYEQNYPDRFRYESIGALDKRTGRREVRSFRDRIVIPFRDILEQLDGFMKQAAEMVSGAELRDAREWSALHDLAMEWESLACDLYQRGLL